jgi:hypothetical protein
MGGGLGSVSPARWWPVWWPVGGSDAVVASRRRARPLLFFLFFVLFAVRLNSGARQTMLHAV